jgi:excisionase family DNA binding protein
MKTVSVEEAAKILGKHKRTLYRWINEKKFKKVVQAGKMVILQEDIDNYLGPRIIN